MAVDDLTSVNVADSVLVEFIEHVALAGGNYSLRYTIEEDNNG